MDVMSVAGKIILRGEPLVACRAPSRLLVDGERVALVVALLRERLRAQSTPELVVGLRLVGLRVHGEVVLAIEHLATHFARKVLSLPQVLFLWYTRGSKVLRNSIHKGFGDNLRPGNAVQEVECTIITSSDRVKVIRVVSKGELIKMGNIHTLKLNNRRKKHHPESKDFHANLQRL